MQILAMVVPQHPPVIAIFILNAAIIAFATISHQATALRF
jgi:hypothetical protein